LTAGEYCEENVCRPGCKSDSNCPFGQICGAGECLAGCNFNNDCPLEQVSSRQDAILTMIGKEFST